MVWFEEGSKAAVCEQTCQRCETCQQHYPGKAVKIIQVARHPYT